MTASTTRNTVLPPDEPLDELCSRAVRGSLDVCVGIGPGATYDEPTGKEGQGA